MFIFMILTYTFCVSECFRDLEGSTRIINGLKVKEGEFPSMVALLRYKRFICGATIFKPNFVLTAAHCVHEKSKYQVQAGIIDLDQVGFQRKVKKKIIHPDFTYPHLSNDIAILELESALPLIRGKIKCARLPKYSTKIPHEYGTVIGFGQTVDKNNCISHQLMKVKLIPEGCTVAKHFFCLGHPDGDKDTCDGDSGGPFLINNTLYGITSHGLTPYCGDGTPGVYVKVPYYVRWIRTSAGMKCRT
ncbi:kallikrein-7-like [Harmonia axyridis]|uniref:kallikrein-7-like n=1 Tax=Harmonia axyridis TaxID=115357 RepID=UPI001E2783C4|nr:kallikrein-7-like [Harmonia axyridis]